MGKRYERSRKEGLDRNRNSVRGKVGRRRRLGEIYERRRKQRLDRNRNSVRGKEGRRKRLGERYERSRKAKKEKKEDGKGSQRTSCDSHILQVTMVPGYTQEEKVAIATRHLLPKQLKVCHPRKTLGLNVN